MSSDTLSNLELIGRTFHRAALLAEAIVNAIPKGTDVFEESAVMEVAYAKPGLLAEFIMTLPAENLADRAVKARASAWLEGHYWPKDDGGSATEGKV